MTDLTSTYVDDPSLASTAPSRVAVTFRTTALPKVEGAGTSMRVFHDPSERYEVVTLLGEGGLGTVVEARDRDIGRRVAIKRLRADRRSNEATVRFVKEVRTVGQLEHPNIAPIHDVGRDGTGDLYFVMKHVEGETLERILERLRAGEADALRRFTWARRVDIMVATLHAVAYAHGRGVIHRDLKPANIMVGPQGEVQLIDWGVAKVVGQADDDAPSGEAESVGKPSSLQTTRVGAVIGTPLYMAPEQARGGVIDERTDTFALSLIFFELLTLAHPYAHAGSIDELLALAAACEIPHPRDLPSDPRQGAVPADLMWIVHDGTRADPAARYPTVRAMIERLERRADGEIRVQCPMTFQKSVLQRLQGSLDRHPFAFTAAAAVFVAGGLGAVAGSAVLLLSLGLGVGLALG